MFAIGIYSIVNLAQYGFFTQGTYIAGAVIFVIVGVIKFVFGLLGILVLFVQKKPLIIIVSYASFKVVCFLVVCVCL